MDIKNKILSLFKVYQVGFEPPKWVKNINLTDYWKTTIVYYDKNTKDFKELIKFRIPVNIGMNLYYSEKLMKKYFGYKDSIYNENSSNIAVFTKTPVIIKNNKYDINVINVIAPALDSYEQKDYIKIKNKIGFDKKKTKEEMYEMMLEKCFKKIKMCFKKFDILIMSGFGLGAFSSLCKELNIDCYKVYKKCFIKYFGKSKKKIYLNFLPFEMEKDNFININEDIYDLIEKTENLDRILFVNAWDPYSLVGNGNSMDNSLDGYFGRISAMSVLCWSITNPYIQYKEAN